MDAASLMVQSFVTDITNVSDIVTEAEQKLHLLQTKDKEINDFYTILKQLSKI